MQAGQIEAGRSHHGGIRPQQAAGAEQNVYVRGVHLLSAAAAEIHNSEALWREDGGIFLYKSGSALYEIEPLSEYLAAQLSAQLCPGAVPYDMACCRGKLASRCPLFTDEATGLAKAGAVFRGEERTIPELLAFFESIGSGDAFRRMCVLDAVILNPDRHYGSFGVLFDTDTLAIRGMAPVFDHNRSLLPELDNDQLADPAWYLRHCKPKLGRDFIRNAKGLLTDPVQDCADIAKSLFGVIPDDITLEEAKEERRSRI